DLPPVKNSARQETTKRPPRPNDPERGGSSSHHGRARAIAYVRVSTQGQAERGMSLTHQRDRLREYAKQRGYDLLDVVEEAASGAIREGEDFSWEHRPALLELMESAA